MEVSYRRLRGWLKWYGIKENVDILAKLLQEEFRLEIRNPAKSRAILCRYRPQKMDAKKSWFCSRRGEKVTLTVCNTCDKYLQEKRTKRERKAWKSLHQEELGL